MRLRRYAAVCRLGRLARAGLAVAVLGCMAWSVVGAQEPEGEADGAHGVPQWLPRPSRFFDRPMTETEYRYCLRRTDVPKWGPHGHPPGDLPPAPRCPLEEQVSIEVNGTVVQALKALLDPSKRLWLAGIRGDSADKVAQFTQKDVPLWKALDALLEAYGYDWGFSHGAVVCWPALIPHRARPETPEAAPADAQPPAAEPLEIPEPTPVDTILDHFRPARYPWDEGMMHVSLRVALDDRLRDWKLVGRVTKERTDDSILRVAAALPAVVQGKPLEGCITMGAHMWLDRAMRGAEARAAALKAEGIEFRDNKLHYLPPELRALGAQADDTKFYALPLQQRIRALLTAQHWALMDQRGVAVIWFRELPLEVAELWVLAARASEPRWARFNAKPGEKGITDHSVDWSRPENIYAMAYYGEIVRKSGEDGLYRVMGHNVSIALSVPMKSGGGRGL